MHLLALFTTALLISSVLTHYVRNAALKRGWTFISIRRRDVHTTPIPRLGGVAICATFLMVAIGYFAFKWILGVPAGLGPHTFAVLVPACLMFILGLADDLRPIPPQVKFGVQIVAGMLLYYGGVRIYFIPLVSGYHELSSAISLLATVFWVLLISNAFNLIDGLDGLSAGSALFSTLVVFIFSLVSGNLFVSVMSVTLAGATLGFLRYNFNPATIFLGDCGSLFLGFMLSAMSLAGAQKSTTLVSVAIPIVSFGLPLLETTLSVVRRFVSGQPLFSADREHIHHKLLKRGFSHKQVVVMLYGVTASLSVVSLLLMYPKGSATGIVVTVVGAGMVFGIQHLGYHEFSELGRAAKRTMDQRQIIVNNLAIRRATEELSSADDLNAIYQALKSAFLFNEFDSFELKFQPTNVRQNWKSALAAQEFDGSFLLSWQQQASTASAPWRLSVALESPAFDSPALFTVFRREPSRNLLFDINLLSGEFTNVLTKALERALDTPEKGVPIGMPPMVMALEPAAVSQRH